ncbi:MULTISPECIES: YecA family protein [unclassified Luteibacter]|uniref:YecA/YgfB family protein n=1 Tax=Lysobacterales TaxID=135614 RepID=UPI00055A1354|nr:MULTISPECIES: YecA family protein [unclassified Luteibacter]
MNTPKSEWPRSLDDAELEKLDIYLRAHGNDGDLMLDGVHGLLSAIAIGPLEVKPEEWLHEVLHDAFEDEDEGNAVLALLAQLNDSISAELDVDAYEPILGEIDTDEGPMLSAGGWCEGFSRGIDMRAQLWETRLAEDPTLMQLLGPIMALAVDEGVLQADAEFEKLTDEEYDECLGQLPEVLNAVGEYWRTNGPTEDELKAMTRPRSEAEDGPPRQRSGHWVH